MGRMAERCVSKGIADNDTKHLGTRVMSSSRWVVHEEVFQIDA